MQPVFAQAAPAPADAPITPSGAAPASGALTNAQSGNEIVVTAAPGDRSRFKTSSSISQISNDSIKNFTPRSIAEVLRAIPGIQTAANAGPGGNANIGVRGIPVSTGGSEYVGIQEDGLPVVLFGDMNFGNNDYWIRFDDTVDRVEAIRGGSASTFSSQSPGAVINYISRTGQHDGGGIAYTEGLDFRQHRVDFDYGGHLSPTLHYNVGGYWEKGAGPSNISYDVLNGYQVKANVTKDLPDDRGYVRILFKRLDEQAPTNTTTPAIAHLDGNQVTGYSLLPGFDPREGSTYSVYTRHFQYVDRDGKLQTADVDGIHPKVTTIGTQIHYELTNQIKFDDNFRYSAISGNFTTQFLNVDPTSSVIGSTVNGQTVGSIRYANGPNQGQLFTGAYLNNNPNIHTVMHNMGNIANNLTLGGKWDLGPGQFNATAGWFYMRQRIVQTWYVNQQFSEILGKNAAELDLFSTTGQQLTAAGQAGFNNNWGTCCARDIDLTYTDNAPFLSAGYTTGGLNLDASVRFDRMTAKGSAQAGATGPDYTVSDALGSATLPSLLPTATPIERLNYLKAYTSWSVGALYSIGNDTSIFARASRGGRFNGDRRVLGGSVSASGVYSGGFFNTDGSLNSGGQATAVNFLNQQEIGLKQRGHFTLFGHENQYTTETTLFHSSLTENNYDFTRINNLPPNNNPYISNKYRSYGVEFTGNIAIADFRLQANMTYTDAKITASTTSPATVGDRPGGIPKFQYFVQASYDPGFFAIGASVDGQTPSYFDDFNQYKLKESHYINAFAKLRPMKNLEIGVNANNVFNTLGYRGGANLSQVGNGLVVFSGTANYGRTVQASVRYNF
ncbi:TonB-dependent receptor domain-containing protein [Sphingomonas oryzagri]|uniref:TonB-dependent receptor plug domain-containing protein n=1 Tax=Sphingomonas oryzagri TaxID=3042314 RepID=A0ABT6N2P1_9SPHN|nr:TonB-dependent receptor [Sphingomonas oryzagri]MDH7639343.1 TonB-dependent receptor plug domain-containing protein [Sphingomonas oryzagri]